MQTRSDRKHELIRTEIKETARQLMAEQGTAGITIRGIARRMDLTAPAIYRYYGSLDDLITDLIVEDFNDLADALEDACAAAEGQPGSDQFIAVLMAYREWALRRPVDFQLIYGNPIPGYSAPAEVTVPAVTRGFQVIVQLVAKAMMRGELIPSQRYAVIPPETYAAMEPITRQDGFNVPVLAIYLATVGWPMIHGIIMLELFNHIQPTTGNVEVFYRAQVENLLVSFGMKL